MNHRPVSILLTALFCWCCSFVSAKTNEKLSNDMKMVWPLIQIIKIEYDLANAQLETIEDPELRKEFLEKYEQFVKNRYFDQLRTLNLRQGKLLLMLIHRELGKTPYDLIKEYRSIKQARFWQNFARFIGANLKAEYFKEDNMELELIIEKMASDDFYLLIPEQKN